MLKGLKFDRLAGVAYAALPIAGAVSLEMNMSWIFMRKEGLAKNYGMQKPIEGEYEKGASQLLKQNGFNLRAFLTTCEVIQIMKKHGKLDNQKYRRCLEFLNA